MKGTFRAKAVDYELGYTSSGKEQIVVTFDLLDGAPMPTIRWYGFFSEKCVTRTLESLRIAGWTGDDITARPLPGLGSRFVELVVVEEEYQGKVQTKVAWVNRPGGGGAKLSDPMDDAKRRAFGALMRAAAKAIPVLPPDSSAQAPAAAPAPAKCRTCAGTGGVERNGQPVTACRDCGGTGLIAPHTPPVDEAPPRTDDDIPF